MNGWALGIVANCQVHFSMVGEPVASEQYAIYKLQTQKRFTE